jgi:hypothetical protein
MATKQIKSGNAKQTRLFDIKTESERIAQALANLKANEKPGEASGMGTKTVILMQQEAAIKELHEAGYTVQQIAKAMSNDVFGILPKSITQLLNKNTTSRKRQPKRVAQPAADKAASPHVADPGNTPIKSKQLTQIGDVE